MVLPFLFVLAGTLASEPLDKPGPMIVPDSELVGEYALHRNRHGGSRVKLNADYTFEFTTRYNFEISLERQGRWTSTGDTVRLEYPPLETYEIPFGSEFVATRCHGQPILIEIGLMPGLCADIVTKGPLYADLFFLRRSPATEARHEGFEIPQRFQRLIRPEVVATVTQSLPGGFVTLDQGAENGLVPTLRLRPTDHKFDGEIQIVKVTGPNSAIGKVAYFHDSESWVKEGMTFTSGFGWSVWPTSSFTRHQSPPESTTVSEYGQRPLPIR